MNVKTILATAHIQPVVGVTVLVTIMSTVYGATGTQLGLVFLAVITGQLSIGFHNNVMDARNDKKSGRKDKAIVNKEISRSFVMRLAIIFLFLSIILSLWLDIGAGLIHLSAVVLAWNYNYSLKNTPLSVVCYMLAFGFIPLFAATLTDSSISLLSVLCFAFIGSTIHFADALGDYELDNKAGIRGFPNIFSLQTSKTIFKLSGSVFVLLAVLDIFFI